MQNLLILYVGDPDAGRALAALIEPLGGYVYLPDSLMQALGMYITYFPQVVVIDMALDYAPEALEHLRSVDADPLLLLTDQRVRAASIYTIPPDAEPEALLHAIEHLADAPALHFA